MKQILMGSAAHNYGKNYCPAAVTLASVPRNNPFIANVPMIISAAAVV
jgi:hypothetical protein